MAQSGRRSRQEECGRVMAPKGALGTVGSMRTGVCWVPIAPQHHGQHLTHSGPSKILVDHKVKQRLKRKCAQGQGREMGSH